MPYLYPELIQRAREAGLLSIVDGARAPGRIAIDRGDLEPDFYAASLHKWLSSPPGSASLYAAVFQNHLYIGTLNWATGGEVWMKLINEIYLPLVMRNH